MRAGIFTREYPPEVYGGAGVHVAELTRHLRQLVDVDVHCWGEPRTEAGVTAHSADPELAGANPALRTLSTGLRMADAASEIDVAHSHTWYAGLAGHLAGTLYGVPHVVTAHSLEPHRPWKREQLGGGYDVSSWSEKNAMVNADAIIAVSRGMKNAIVDAYPDSDEDKIHVVLNGIDTQVWQPRHGTYLDSLGVDRSRPIVAFVGRITQQKGVEHLLKAARSFHPDTQLILCAGAPDTPEIKGRVEKLVATLQAERDGVWWIQEMLDKDRVQQVYTAADVFVCPSIYEPLGIVNLEAMACGTAVVASDVGGIPEVVSDGDTGRLVHYDASHPAEFEERLAGAVNDVISQSGLTEKMGTLGRARAIDNFSWSTIATQTLNVYESLM